MKEYGYFSKNGYAITKRDTPEHWYNYLFNDHYIASVSQVGYGQSAVTDANGKSHTVFNDRTIYVYDGERFWQAGALPVEMQVQGYYCEHCIGYTDIVLTHRHIRTECRYFVGRNSQREYVRVTVKNQSRQARCIKIIPYLSPASSACIQADFLDNNNCVAARISGTEQGDYYAYLMSSEVVTSFDTRHATFIGTYGEKSKPKVFIDYQGLANSTCLGERSCLAIENSVTLDSGESKTFYYTIGVETQQDSIIQQLPAEIEEQFEESHSYYQHNNLRIHTPWDDLDNLFNDWLPYQIQLGCHHNVAAAPHFIDRVTSITALADFNPKCAFDQLIKTLGCQKQNGEFANDSDTSAFISMTELIIATFETIKELSQVDLLFTRVPFSDGGEATVYEHIRRTVTLLWNTTDQNGLIAHNGNGDPLLSMFFIRAAKKLSVMANWIGSAADSKSCAHYAQEMQNRINRCVWNNDHYRHCISQKFSTAYHAAEQIISVLSEFDAERTTAAMDILEQHLNTDLGIHQSVSIGPNETLLSHDVSLITSAQKLVADSILGRNDKIEEGLRKILPSHYEFFEKATLPYTLPDAYFGEQTDYRAGSARKNWCTSASAWLLYALTNYIFGLKADFGGLKIAPSLPPSWKDCSISKVFRGCRYHIHYVQKGSGICRNIDALYVNGSEVSPLLPIKPQPDKTLNIEVILKA